MLITNNHVSQYIMNICRIVRATQQERLYNVCGWLKKIHFAKNFFKMSKIILSHFQKQSSRVLKIHRKSPVLDSPLNKAEILQSATLIKKEAPAQTFSYEFYEIFKNTFRRLLGFSLLQERFLFMHFFL